MTLHGKRFIIYGIAVFCIQLLLNCQSANISGGLETTNGFITASCVDGTITGFGKPGTRVTLCDSAYSVQHSTDHYIRNHEIGMSGVYTFDHLPDGIYNLYCWDDDKTTGISIPNVASGQDGPLFNDTLWLKPSHRISGTVLLGENASDSITVAITGSPLWAMTDNNSSYTITNVPEGRFRLHASLTVMSLGDTAHFEGTDEILITKDSTDIPVLQIWEKH